MFRFIKVLSFSFLFCGVIFSQNYDDDRAAVLRNIGTYAGDLMELTQTDKELADVLLNKVLIGLEADINSIEYLKAIEILSDYNTINFMDRTAPLINTYSSYEYRKICSLLHDYNRISGEEIIATTAKKMALDRVRKAILAYFMMELKVVEPMPLDKLFLRSTVNTEPVSIKKATAITQEEIQAKIEDIGKEAFEETQTKTKWLMEIYTYGETGVAPRDLDLVNAFLDKIFLDLSSTETKVFNFAMGILFNPDVVDLMNRSSVDLAYSPGLYVAYSKMLTVIKDYSLFERSNRLSISANPALVELKTQKLNELTRSIRLYRGR